MSHPHSNGVSTQSSRASSCPGGDIADDLRYLVRSVEPAIVFTSLARLCVPAFSDECTVDIVEGDEVAYRIRYPCCDPNGDTAATRNQTGRRPASTDPGYAVRTRFASPGYAGVLTHVWRTRVPTPADASCALILARHGVDTVRAERRDVDRRHGHDTVEQLRAVTAVASSLDPATAALLDSRARRPHPRARCVTGPVARR